MSSGNIPSTIEVMLPADETKQIGPIDRLSGPEQEKPVAIERIIEELEHLDLHVPLQVDEQVPAGDEIEM
jgi:hypothetical protein